MITSKQFTDGWGHFCSRINWGDSNMDAEAIQFMNEVPGQVVKVLEYAPDLLAACEAMLLPIENLCIDWDQQPAVIQAKAAIAKAKQK